MLEKPDSQRRFTRRRFLMGLPVGVLGALAVGFVSGRVVGSFLGRPGHAEPPKDSIYTPAKDRHTRA